MSRAEANFRKEIVNKIIPYAEKDPRYFILISDMGFGVSDAFKARFPERILNTGIMEQGTVGIAAGMATTGLIPIVYSIVNFLAFRSLEQIRNDVVLQGLNVKFIATGVNDYFSFLGSSHCCGVDDKKIMDIINLRVFDPYESEDVDFDRMVHDWLTDSKAGYMRV